MVIIWTIIKLLIVLGVVATIHEFGHFIFAKMFKMKVNEFSIGLGPKIWQKEYKGTMYSLRWIPLGGYNAIEGEEEESEDKDAFPNKPCYQRLIVLLAGVTFNAILAAVLFLGVNLGSSTFGTRIAKIDENSAAYISGLRTSDIITKIGDKDTNIYQDVALYNDVKDKDVKVEYIRDGKHQETIVKNAVKEIGYIGVYFDSNKVDENGKVLTYINLVEPGMPSVAANIKSEDQIIKVDGKDVKYSYEVTDIVSKNPEKEIDIVVLRGGKEVSLKVTPMKKLSFDLGDIAFAKEKTTLKMAYFKSINTISQIVNSYVDLFTGKVNVKQLSGIVGIGEVVSKTSGILEFLSTLAMISLAVGIANILPFPPLDGGKIVLVLIEWITKKKVSLKVETVLSYIGLTLLIGLTIFVTINDIIRLV